MKLCMIRPFADCIERLRTAESAKIEHLNWRTRTGGVHATVFTKPTATRDLFAIQTSAGTCWKG